MTEKNGVFDYPWGAAHYSWGEQLFWDSMPELRNQTRQEMILSAQKIQADGKAANLSCVAWGFEFGAATGGDVSKGWADLSQAPGWKEWGRWLSARKDKYLALNIDGEVHYPAAGYVTPLMPLDKEDWPAGIDSATFGDLAGLRLGQLANHIQSNGFFAADFIVGLYGENHDFHPRVVADFEKWAGVKVAGTTVRARATDLIAHHWPRWNDFKAHRFARFYARAAETIRASGRVPRVGGQILPYASQSRGWGNDFRIYLQHLPAENWYFQVEVQSDEGRAIQPYWWAAAAMGGQAARAPDFPLGAHMDAYHAQFWAAVKNAGKDSAWGRNYMKHHWLTVGWTHVANTKGVVNRAPQAFQRHYWDEGKIDTPIVALVRKHIPRHPFGPAIYFSTNLERQSEAFGEYGFWYWLEPNSLDWLRQGVPAGYYVSDTALANLKPENRPSGWFVYVDGMGRTKLSAQEKARLEAIAPILSLKNFSDSCPLSFEGDSLGGYGFIDQNGSVIVVSSNSSDKNVSGTIRFAKVGNGSFKVKDLLTGDTATLVISGNRGRLPLTWAAGDTRVLEIPNLRELGQLRTVGNGPRQELPAKPEPGVMRPDGQWINIIGRRTTQGSNLTWSSEDK